MCNESTHLIPTLLYVNDGRTGQVTIGAEVRTAALDQVPGNRLFRNFKRSIGSDLSEARLIDGAPWTDMDAGQAFLHRLIASLPYPVEEMDQLVVTVPVGAFEGYTAWLQRTFTGFPPNRMRVVDESTAAALGYAVTEPGAIVLVIDFGGGSLDLSLVRLPESREKTGKILFTSLPERGSTATVIAKAGVALGGSDIDRWLMDCVLERTGVPGAQLGKHYTELLSACERAKIALSTQDSAEVCFHLEDGSAKQAVLARLELETIMERQGFYRSLRLALDKVMGLAHQKGVYREDIGHVLLVGGTSLIPSVQKSLDDYFRAITRRHKRLFDIPEWPALTWKVDTTTIRVDKPFTAVVEGALQVSAGFGLDDHLSQGYGLRYFDPSSGGQRYEVIIFEDVLTNGLPHQRASAAQHIYHFSWFAASPLFEIALNDPDPRTREAAVFALCKMRLPEAYRRVMEILQHGSEAMRMAAVWGLHSHPDAAAVPVLALAAQADSTDIRVEAMEVLGATEAAEAIPVVRRGMADTSPEVIYAAALSWVELAGTACLAPLADAVEASTGLERRAILRGLFHATNYMGIDSAGSPAAGRLIDALETALHDPLPAARRAATMQLAWMRHPRAEAALLRGFHGEPDSTTRAQMLANIVNLMSPLARPLLEESLCSADIIVRQTAEYLQSKAA